MPDRDRFASVHLDTFDQSSDASRLVPRDDTPFCVAILADLSARTGREELVPLPPLAARRAMLVDRDDLDAVLARVAPTLSLALDGGASVTLRVSSLDDLHPDRLYERLPLFAALRETRRRLADPATFAAAARELGASDGGGAAPATPATPASPAPTGGLLDQILGESPEQGPPPGQGGDLAAFIRQAVRPYLVPRPDPRQAELLAAVDSAIAAQLRQLLHHPAVRALEATWRGLDFLVRRVETSSQLRLAVFDVTGAELAADAARGADGDLARLLAAAGESLPEPAPWSLVVPLFDVGDGTADLRLLHHLALVGAAQGAAVLTSAHPRLAMLAADADADAPDAGDASAAESRALWRSLRRSPAAPSLGVLLPRILLRLPYGEDGEPCDVLRFEELAPASANAPAHVDSVLAERHGELLWGSPGLAAAVVFASAFAEDGWRMRPRAHLDVERLPLYLHRVGGATVAQPCAEVAFGVSDVEALVSAGLLPLVAPRESDAVRLAGLGSVAEGGGAIAGRWEGVG